MKVERTSKIGSVILHLYILDTSAISFNTNILQIDDAIKLYKGMNLSCFYIVGRFSRTKNGTTGCRRLATL
jgi:hypothetical protein